MASPRYLWPQAAGKNRKKKFCCLPQTLAQCSPRQGQAFGAKAPLTVLRSVLGQRLQTSITKNKRGNDMSKSLVDIFIAIENKTLNNVSSTDKDRRMVEANKRLHELMGMIELAKLMGEDKRFLRALERQVAWVIRRRNAVH